MEFIVYIIVAIIGIFTGYLLRKIRNQKKSNQLEELQQKLNQIKEEASQANFQLGVALNVGHILPLEWDILTDMVRTTLPDAKKIFKALDQSRLEISMSSIISNIHHDDQEEFIKLITDIKNSIREEGQIILRYDVSHNFDYYFEVGIRSYQKKIIGEPFTVIGYVKDITQKKKAETIQREKEQFFINVLDNIPFPIHVKDIENDFKYIYWNKESSRIFGEGLFKSAGDLLDSQSVKIIQDIDRQVYETEIPYQGYESISTLDGRQYETLVNKSIIRNMGKKLELIVRWDVTDLIEYQRKEKLLLAYTKLADAYYWSCDLRTGKFEFSPEFEKIGLDENLVNDLEGFGKLLHPDDLEKYRNFINWLMDSEFKEQTITYRIRRGPANTYEWWEARCMLDTINSHSGTYHYLYGIATNINKHKEIQAQLAEALAKAQHSDKLKSAFLANMSHEIRTPLNSIVGFSSLLVETENEEEKKEFSSIISANSELLLRLIDDILDLSKMESELVDYNPAEFDLATYFDEMAITMKQLLKKPEIEFIVINPYKKCILEGDKNRLTQLVTNYVTNAIKYTVKGYIKMGYIYIGGGIKVYIEDSGIGIPDNQKNRLFKRFEKLNDFAQGTGLGLSICKAIAEGCGGTVGFESQEGVGSTFWAFWPLKAEIEEK